MQNTLPKRASRMLLPLRMSRNSRMPFSFHTCFACMPPSSFCCAATAAADLASSGVLLTMRVTIPHQIGRSGTVSISQCTDVCATPRSTSSAAGMSPRTFPDVFVLLGPASLVLNSPALSQGKTVGVRLHPSVAVAILV